MRMLWLESARPVTKPSTLLGSDPDAAGAEPLPEWEAAGTKAGQSLEVKAL